MKAIPKVTAAAGQEKKFHITSAQPAIPCFTEPRFQLRKTFTQYTTTRVKTLDERKKKSRKQYYCTIIPPQRAFHHDDGLGGTHPSSSSADKIGTVWYGRYVRISVVLFGASELVLIDDGRTANVGFGWLTVLCWSLPASYQHYFSRRGFHHAHNTQRQGHKHSREIMLPVWMNQQRGVRN